MLSVAVVVCQDVCLVDNVRTCSVRDMYKDIINMMLKRNGEPEDPIGVNEVYFLLDGSKVPNQAQLMRPFPANKAVKEF